MPDWTSAALKESQPQQLTTALIDLADYCGLLSDLAGDSSKGCAAFTATAERRAPHAGGALKVRSLAADEGGMPP